MDRFQEIAEKLGDEFVWEESKKAALKLLAKALRQSHAQGRREAWAAAAKMMRRTRKGMTPEWWARQFEAKSSPVADEGKCDCGLKPCRCIGEAAKEK